MAKLLANFYTQIYRNSVTPKSIPIRNFAFFKTKKKKDCKTALDNYVFVQPEKEEFNKVYKLMVDSYFTDEPTVRSLDAGFRYNPMFEKEVYETLEYGYSYVAKCKWTGCIIGACLNFSVSEFYPDLLRKFACTVKDEDTRQLLFFYAYLQEAPELFEKYCESEMFVIRAIAVDKDNRNLKVATELISLSRALGKDLAYPIIRCDSSNYAISKICEKLGMEWEYELKYCQYIGHDHKPVFDPPPPNLVVSTYIDLPLRLPPK